MNIDLNQTKTWFANNRSGVNFLLQRANLVNTVAYLTSAISEETYTIALLSGMVGEAAFNLIDASVCYAAKGVPSIKDSEVEQKIEALKVAAAFKEHKDLNLYLQMSFGFPGIEALQNRTKWEIAKGCASFLANSVAPFYASIKQVAALRSCEWSFIIPYMGLKIAAESLKEAARAEDTIRDTETLSRWLSVLQKPSGGPELLSVHEEMEENFVSTLNRVMAFNPQIGMQFEEAFQTQNSHSIREK